MNACPDCGCPDVYEEYTDVYAGMHQMHCNGCDADYQVEIGAEDD